jgi:hypothetical protein
MDNVMPFPARNRLRTQLDVDDRIKAARQCATEYGLVAKAWGRQFVQSDVDRSEAIVLQAALRVAHERIVIGPGLSPEQRAAAMAARDADPRTEVWQRLAVVLGEAMFTNEDDD